MAQLVFCTSVGLAEYVSVKAML